MPPSKAAKTVLKAAPEAEGDGGEEGGKEEDNDTNNANGKGEREE